MDNVFILVDSAGDGHNAGSDILGVYASREAAMEASVDYEKLYDRPAVIVERTVNYLGCFRS